MNKRQIKADEFRALAHAAATSAAASPLGHVREKFERSADVWTKLADNEERQDAATLVYRGRTRADADLETDVEADADAPLEEAAQEA